IAAPPSLPILFLPSSTHPRELHSFPTRRSSDLRLWPIILGGLFVTVIMFFPDGLLGVGSRLKAVLARRVPLAPAAAPAARAYPRSEEHTCELQSRGHLVCRLLLEKKNNPISPRR